MMVFINFKITIEKVKNRKTAPGWLNKPKQNNKICHYKRNFDKQKTKSVFETIKTYIKINLL